MPERYAVGVVNYRSYDELGRCLDAVGAQTVLPEAIVVVDADPDPGRRASLGERPSVAWIETPNLGYAGGANAAIAALAERTDASFVLLLNPDVRLEPGFAQHLVAEMAQRPFVALGTGKLLRADGSIDSAGITLPQHRRPRDRGSGQPDRGRYDCIEYVFGANGAAMMLRCDALGALAIDGEVFDEDFFLYHEDTDLSWRAQLLGWRVLYVPLARAVHERGWQKGRRFDIAASVRRHSFKNHYLQLIKNEQPRDFFLNLPVLAGWEMLRLAFALSCDRAVLAGYRDGWRLAGRAFEKRRLLRAAVREAQAERQSTA